MTYLKRLRSDLAHSISYRYGTPNRDLQFMYEFNFPHILASISVSSFFPPLARTTRANAENAED